MGATIDDEIRGHPHRTPTLPWAHAAGVVACDRTELVAVSDVDAEKGEAIRARYGAPAAYTDYREMMTASARTSSASPRAPPPTAR